MASYCERVVAVARRPARNKLTRRGGLVPTRIALFELSIESLHDMRQGGQSNIWFEVWFFVSDPIVPGKSDRPSTWASYFCNLLTEICRRYGWLPPLGQHSKGR